MSRPGSDGGSLTRQRELGVPQSLEWVHETVPGLLPVAQAYGLHTELRPLLVLTKLVPPPSVAGVGVAMLEPDDPRFVDAGAAVSAGFESRDDLRPEPVGGGTAAPRGDVCELTGIAVLPRSRGRGVGTTITAALARDAITRGAELVWLSATDDDVARVDQRAGFSRVATTCEASSPPTR